MVNGIIYGMFALFVILGILFGLKRGLVKSVVRLITVLISCVVVVFVVSRISSALLKADISGLGLVVGDVQITSISEAIINYISQISIIAGLLKTSPTLTAVVNAIPAVIVNIVLFIVLFFVVKAILYFVDIIINKIIIKKDSDKPKRRLWGALVGAVQGIVVFLFVLIPIAGTMNLVNDALKVVDEQPQTVQQSTLVNLSVKNGEQTTAEIKNSTKVIADYKNNVLIKIFNAIGYKNLTNAVYDKITTIEITDQEKTTLRAETMVVAKVFNSYEKLKNVNVAELSDADEKNAHELIDNAFSSPIIGGVVTELTTGLANAWTGLEPTSFVGLEKPIIDENLLDVLDNLLINLRTDTKEDLNKDLKVLVSTLKVSSDYGVTKNVVGGNSNTDNLVQSIGQEGCMENIVGTLATGKVTKEIIPSFIEFGLNYGYMAMEINNNEVVITKTSSEVNWETEKVVLGDLFEGVGQTFSSINKEGELIDKLDFLALAKTMNAIRESQLLEDAGQDISVNLLQSNLLSGIDTSTLVLYIENDQKYDELDFEKMLLTVKSSAQIAKDLENIKNPESDVTELNKDDVGTLIGGLTGNDATKEVLKDLASEESLESAGVEKPMAGAIGELVGAIAGYDTTEPNAVQPPQEDAEIESATGAVESLLGASSNAKDLNKNFVFSDNELEAKEKMNDFVDNILSSEFIYVVTIDKGIELGFRTETQSNLSDYEQTWLNQVLNDSTNPNLTAQKKSEIKNMFMI